MSQSVNSVHIHTVEPRIRLFGSIQSIICYDKMVFLFEAIQITLWFAFGHGHNLRNTLLLARFIFGFRIHVFLLLSGNQLIHLGHESRTLLRVCTYVACTIPSRLSRSGSRQCSFVVDDAGSPTYYVVPTIREPKDVPSCSTLTVDIFTCEVSIMRTPSQKGELLMM